MPMSEPNVASHVSTSRDPSSKRWWWWKASLPIGLLLSAVAVAVLYLTFVPQFEAAALLEINEHAPYIAFEPKEAGVSKAYFRTQMEIIRSRWIMGLTVASEKVKQLPEIREQRDPIDWLLKKVSVVSRNDSDIFDIKYTSSSPENAALVVNEVTHQYLEAQKKEEASRFRNILATLNQETASREDAVRTLRKQVETAAQKVSGEEPDTEQSDRSFATRDPLSELRTQLIEVQVKRYMLSAAIKAAEEDLRTADEAGAAHDEAAAKASAAQQSKKEKEKRVLSKDEIELRDAMVRKAIEDNAEVKQWHSLLVPKQMQLLQIETTAEQGKQHPSYLQLQNEIAKAEQKLEELKQKLAAPIQKEAEFSLRARRSDGVNNGVTMIAKRREKLEQMRSELRTFEIAEGNLREAYNKRLNELFQQREQLSNEKLNLKFKKDELAQAQTVLTKITERQVALQTERSAPPRVIWHEPAKAPQAPVERLPYRNMVLAGLCGLCLPYAGGMLALILWNLGKLIRKLEPVQTDAVVNPSPPPNHKAEVSG